MISAIGADGALYPIEKMRAHRMGVRHLAVSVFVTAGDLLLLQRRADGKYHCGGLWANTCCSHPDFGEPIAASARRRLREELGIDLALTAGAVIDYEADVTDGLRECERVHVFYADAGAESLPLDPDPDEVAETRWRPLAAIRRDAALRPEAYAPWFLIYLARWDELGVAMAPLVAARG
ncbi:MAG: NUDIX domain-containing protein [Alphaproteobacteria bacterium]|nr:NUDIX domain-containing protein [Alphaproteobacteria bacterium]